VYQQGVIMQAQPQAQPQPQAASEGVLSFMDPQNLIEPQRQAALKKNNIASEMDHQEKRDQKAMVRDAKSQKTHAEVKLPKHQQQNKNFKNVVGDRKPSHRPMVSQE
jgi:hypothetical protein